MSLASKPPRPPGARHVEIEIAPAALPRACARAAAPGVAKTFEAGVARLALRIDLAAVELRALVRVAQNLIGAVELGELLLRLRVGGVLVRMQFLGEAPIGFLDVLGRGRLGHAKNRVGIAHSS